MRLLFAPILTTATLVLTPSAQAGPLEVLETVLATHIEPGYAALADSSAHLAEVAATTCDPTDTALQAAFHQAWDDWIAMSHIRFGPSETHNRAFALGFWPDARATVPKTLRALIAAQDPAVETPEAFAHVSIAGRGFTALEYLLFDPEFAQDAAYPCALRRAVARDIAATSAAIAGDWTGLYGAAFLTFDATTPFRTEEEALTALFGAVLTGMEFTEDTRLGRPMGTFERPRPTRAEARRSARSVRHIRLSTQSAASLSALLAAEHPEVAALVATEFAQTLAAIDRLRDPALADVAEPSGRLRAEAVAQLLDLTATRVRDQVGGLYGLSEGFSQLDGD